MFFIAGTKGETSTVATGRFYCPECEDQTIYSFNQVHQVATVFFIPLAKLKLLGEYVECQHCGYTYDKEILDYDPEIEHLEFEVLYLAGLKRVLVTMMLADGKIDEKEKKMMKDVYQRLVNSDLSDKEIEIEVENCRNCPVGLEEYLKDLFPRLNESGREVIIKVAYWMSVASGEYTLDERKLLGKLAKFFKISNTHLKGIIAEIDEIVSEQRRES